MQLPDDLLKRLANEFRFAADNMRETKDPYRKLYYLSVLYGEPTRILNFAWDRDLALIHHVLQKTHLDVASRLQSIDSRLERVLILPDVFWEALADVARSLADYVEKHGDESELCRIMGRFAELAYITTGNGYYLFSKGQITL